jgi:hypothetical protein
VDQAGLGGIGWLEVAPKGAQTVFVLADAVGWNKQDRIGESGGVTIRCEDAHDPHASPRLEEQSGDGRRDCCSVTDGAIDQNRRGVLPLLVQGVHLAPQQSCDRFAPEAITKRRNERSWPTEGLLARANWISIQLGNMFGGALPRRCGTSMRTSAGCGAPWQAVAVS